MSGISTQNDFDISAADGTTVDFTFTFFVYDPAQIKLYSVLNDILTPINSGFTITQNSNFQGGNIKFTTAPLAPVGQILRRRETPYTQTTEFTDLVRYKETAIERMANTLAMQIQQVFSKIGRALRFTEASGVTDPTIGTPVDGSALVFDGVQGRVKAGPNATQIANAQGYATTAQSAASTASAGAAIVTAALAAANLPATLVGQALKFLRVKADASGYEHITGATIVTDLGLATDAEVAAALANYSTTTQMNTAIANLTVPRKVQDLMRTARYGNQPSSIFVFPDPPTAIASGTFTRATAAQATNRARILGNYVSGAARHDYNSKTGKYRGVYMENARTNLASFSEDQTNGVWSKTGVTVTANNGVGPYAASTLDGIKETAVNAAHYAWNRAFTIVAGDSVHVSEFVIADGTNQFTLLCDITGGAFASAVFSALNTATPVANKNGPSSAGAVTCINAEIEDWTAVTPGLFRVKASFQTAGQTTTNIYHRMTDAAGNMSYLGNVANGQKIGCVQVEIGSSGTGGHQRCTSYIPALAGTATRNQDTWTFNPGSFDFYAQEGTMFFVGTLDHFTELFTGQVLMSLDDTTVNNSMAITVDSTGGVSLGVTAGGVAQANPPCAQVVTPGQEFCVVARFKANDFQIAVNGVLGTPDTLGSVPTITQLQIGKYGTIWNLNGAVRMFGIINAALPDADLQDISKWLPLA